MSVKRIILLIFILAFICSNTFAGKYKLNNPRYARIVLSKDKKKVLTIALDTTSPDSEKYKLLYISKKFDGSFTDINRYPGKVKYEYGIFGHVTFPEQKFPPLFSRAAIEGTVVNVEYIANQEEIKEKESKRKTKRNILTISSMQPPTFIDGFWLTVKYTISEKKRRKKHVWNYTIKRMIKMSDSLKTAPICDLNEKPKLILQIVNSMKEKNKMGIIASMNILDHENTVTNEVPFWDNSINIKKDGSRLLAYIFPIKESGERYLSRMAPITILKYNNQYKNTKSSSENIEIAKHILKIPKKATSIELIVNAGPMFGVLKTKKKIENEYNRKNKK